VNKSGWFDPYNVRNRALRNTWCAVSFRATKLILLQKIDFRSHGNYLTRSDIIQQRQRENRRGASRDYHHHVLA
jgi:hypothetical protein